MCQRKARGTGAPAQIGVSCAHWGVKVLIKNHVDTLIRATDSGQDGQLLGSSSHARRSDLVEDARHLGRGLSLGSRSGRSLGLTLC